ncbi:MAG: hypothetical protein ACXW3E_14520, partial [Thermoanaerobaculia bacterium]
MEDFFAAGAAGAAGTATVLAALAARPMRAFSRCSVRFLFWRFARDFSPLIRDIEIPFNRLETDHRALSLPA